ncbi:MAG TPA: helix-turn-helix domain-containing protein [Woeseiaceae bacterium]|nr:helix-turn-helix domain-containing protein [Woeseiaceae bacterium]
MSDEPKKSKPLIFVVLDAPASCLDLKLTDKSVLCALVSYLNSRRNGAEVWPGNERLAEQRGTSVDTIRRSKNRLHDSGLIKISRDSGKSDLVTINEGLIRSLCDPQQIARGQEADPPQNAAGTPSKMRGVPLANCEGTPSKLLGEQPKEQPIEQPSGKSGLSNLGCSRNSRVADGPHQRKMAMVGIVAEAAESMRVTSQEQPKEEKTDWQEARRQATGCSD